jgi:hypothetical protein
VSRLPPKSASILVRAAFGGRRHRLSSHRRSIFHLSICFVLFPAHLVHTSFPNHTTCIYSSVPPHVFVWDCFVVTCLCWPALLVCVYSVFYFTRYDIVFIQYYCDCLRVCTFALAGGFDAVVSVCWFLLPNKVCACSQLSALLHLTPLPVRTPFGSRICFQMGQ